MTTYEFKVTYKNEKYITDWVIVTAEGYDSARAAFVKGTGRSAFEITAINLLGAVAPILPATGARRLQGEELAALKRRERTERARARFDR